MTDFNPYSQLTREQARAKLNGRDYARFHAWNVRGIMAEWSDLGDALMAHGRGFLAYGDTGYYYREMSRLARLERVSKTTVDVLVQCITRTIDKGNAFLAAEQVEA